MSIIANSLLSRAINELKLTKPSDILFALSKGIDETLRQNEKLFIKDGMDLALCALHRENKILEYAGVFNPLYIVRNDEVLSFKPDKHAIGERFKTAGTSYTNYTIDLEPNDTIYLCTDGYSDQFGGPDGKKFMSKRLKEKLLEIRQLPLDEQKTALETIIQNWQGANPQIDDILIMGVKL